MSKLFNGFTEFTQSVGNEITIYGLKAGKGPPLLLLHGFPETHLMWHRIVHQLAQTYTVIAIDLRGYGKSSKPAGDAQHLTYSKRALAGDCVRVMTALNYPKFFICAHDRGARVAHQLCIDHPTAVQKVILLDIAPTLVMYSQTDFDFAKSYYHWFFLIQRSPYPENMITGNPEAFMELQMGQRPNDAGGHLFDPRAWDAYLDMLRDPKAVHAMCEDYRASATIDMEHQRKDVEEGRKIQCPLLVLWGKKGMIEMKFDGVADWEAVTASTVQGEALDCGHYIPEEVPDVLLERLYKFFGDKQ